MEGDFLKGKKQTDNEGFKWMKKEKKAQRKIRNHN